MNASLNPQTLFQFMVNPRKTSAAWIKQPHHRHGLIVLFLVALELSLSMRIKNNGGFDLSFVGQVLGVGLVLLFIEGLIIQISSQISSIFEKKANIWHVFSLFNLSLMPFLLILPCTLILELCGASMILRGLLFLVLALKIFQNWKAIVEVVYDLKPWQGAIVVLCIGVGIYIFIPLLFSLSLLNAPSQLDF